MLTRHTLSLSLAALLASCSQAPLTLIVQLRTDLLTGVDFDSVQTELRRDGVSEFLRTTVSARGDLLAGLPVAEFHELSTGTHEVVVNLLGPRGELVAARPLFVTLSASTAVTAVITRNCVGVICPAATDAPGAIACVDGTCVVPECTPEAPESCGPATCDIDSDCPVGPMCTMGRCVFGACLVAIDHSVCEPGGTCDPELGCSSPPVDAGGPDAGPPDAGPPDSGPPDAGPPDAGPPPPPCGLLRSGQSMRPRDVVRSCDRSHRLQHQSDGNVVVYVDGAAAWSTRTDGRATQRLEMQTDGNLVLYEEGGSVLFSSRTSGNPGAELTVQNDGNVVIYHSGASIWSTGTAR